MKSKIRKRLKKIYSKRKKWNGAKGPFDKTSILEWELVLIEQIVLEKLVAKL
jgi:hypothetical protein